MKWPAAQWAGRVLRALKKIILIKTSLNPPLEDLIKTIKTAKKTRKFF